MKKKLDLKTTLLLLLVFTIWGNIYVVNKFVLNKIPPFTAIFLRSFVAAITLLILLRVEKAYKKVERSDWKALFLAGFGGYFLAMALQTVAIKLSTASLAALINATNPLAISIMSAIFLKEKLTVRMITGIVIAIFGVYLVLGGVGENTEVLGVVLSLLSVASWSYVSTVNKKLSAKYSPLQITAFGVCIASFFHLIPCVGEIAAGIPVVLDVSSALCIFFLGAIGTGVAHLLWNRALSSTDASICSMFYPVQAIVAALMGILILNERISMGFVMGSCVTIIGILLSLTQPRARQLR